MVCAIAAITYVAYASLVVYNASATYPWFPLPAVIWLPNIAFAILTLVLWIVAARHDRTTPLA